VGGRYIEEQPRARRKTSFARGGYRFEKRLELWPGNSGTKERPLMIVAYPGEKVVINGGVPIAGAWTKVGDGPLWTIKRDRPARPIEDLFYAGQRQTRARMPDQGW